MRDLVLVLTAALLLRACEQRADGSPASALPAAPLLAQSPFGSVSPVRGDWQRADQDGLPLLLFKAEDGRPLAGIGCEPEGKGLRVERMTVAPAAGIETMTVTADNRTRTLPVLWDGASLPIASATLKLRDRMVRSLSRGSGEIELALAGEPPLVLPADRRIGELVAECRG